MPPAATRGPRSPRRGPGVRLLVALLCLAGVLGVVLVGSPMAQSQESIENARQAQERLRLQQVDAAAEIDLLRADDEEVVAAQELLAAEIDVLNDELEAAQNRQAAAQRRHQLAEASRLQLLADIDELRLTAQAQAIEAYVAQESRSSGLLALGSDLHTNLAAPVLIDAAQDDVFDVVDRIRFVETAAEESAADALRATRQARAISAEVDNQLLELHSREVAYAGIQTEIGDRIAELEAEAAQWQRDSATMGAFIRTEQARLDQERLDAIAAAEAEAQRLEAERIEAEQLEAERQAAEAARIEAERLDAVRQAAEAEAEAARVAAQLEADRVAAEADARSAAPAPGPNNPSIVTATPTPTPTATPTPRPGQPTPTSAPATPTPTPSATATAATPGTPAATSTSEPTTSRSVPTPEEEPNPSPTPTSPSSEAAATSTPTPSESASTSEPASSDSSVADPEPTPTLAPVVPTVAPGPTAPAPVVPTVAPTAPPEPTALPEPASAPTVVPTPAPEPAPQPAAQATGMVWPVPGILVSGWGNRVHPIFGTVRMHDGIDLNGSTGDPIVAAAGGTVLSAGWQSGYGNTVVIDHGDGLSTLYAHQTSMNTSTGATVAQGDVIGYVGSTGNSTGPHLHFEVRVRGASQNPLNYLPPR